MNLRKQKDHVKRANLIQHLRKAHGLPHSRFYWRDQTTRQIEKLHNEKHQQTNKVTR